MSKASYEMIEAATQAIRRHPLASDEQYAIREIDARELAEAAVDAAMRELFTANDNLPPEIWF